MAHEQNEETAKLARGVTEVDIIQKCRILGPQPKKRGNQKKQSHFLILAPPPLFLGPHPIFWAPNGFWGPQIDPTPPIKCKTLQFWATLKLISCFFLFLSFIFLRIFFGVND